MWDAEHIESMKRLTPHLANTHALERQSQLLAATRHALETMEVGMMVVRDQSEVIYANSHARRIVSRSDGMALSGDRLSASDAASDARLRAAIRHATTLAASSERPVALAIERPLAKRAYQVMVSPCPREASAAGASSRCAVLIVIDPEPQSAVASTALESLYGLTRREAALAARLAQGEKLQDAARSLSMQYETARSHLRRIFEKTGTSRQSELAVRLAQLATLVRERQP